MSKYDTIIIGGGLGGLVAGATVSKRGQKVLLLEQHYIPGGCATSFKRKDFVMEVGLHELDGLHDLDTKVQIFNYLEVFKHVQFLQVPELFHLYKPELNFTLPHGNETAIKKLTEAFPEEKKGIQKFFELTNGVLKEIPKMPQSKFISRLIYPLMPLLFPNIVKSSGITVGDWLDKHIKNEKLKLILTTNILYYSDNPYNTSMMYFSVAQGSYIGGGGHFIKGGSQKLSDYLAHSIEQMGGQVLLGKMVEDIIVDNGVAVGVKYRDAFNNKIELASIYADTIIANAAIPNVLKMLPIQYQPKVQDKIKDLEESCSLISIYMGFNVDLKKFGVKHYSSFFQGEDIQILSDIKKNYQGDWQNKSFVFVDYSQVNSNLCPDGKSVGVICAADYLSDWEKLDEIAYKKKKEEVAQLFFSRLEKQYPGIINHLEYYEIGTAKTIKKYTLNPKGTPYGFAQKLSQSAQKRDFSIPQIKNLHFASAWTFPGGGFTGTIISGFLTANKITKSSRSSEYDSLRIEDERRVKLIGKKEIAENTIELTFEKPKHFEHLAGQYAILKIDNPHYTELDLPFRSLSIASHSSETTLRFVMRKSESSFKKSCAEMNISETATIFGPTGSFSIQNYKKPIAFLVCGIGITPIIPMLKELEKNQHKGKVMLFYSNKSQKTTAYHNQLLDLKLSNFEYTSVETATEGRINEFYLKSKIDDAANCHFYLVGTSGFVHSMKEMLKTLNVEEQSIFIDNFG
jgi:phytoene dehydrogenase-like protein/ferredoxin-NADP reductase